ncbi:MAG: YiiX family permuted papain-like enzyme [Deltaproteobacteria bacterium]|nr:YiiX family permuted papain-like enzyme [Deltaproteobacteria bacterium]
MKIRKRMIAALIALAALLFLMAAPVLSGAPSYLPIDGDIIFQTSKSSQSRLVQTATASPLSHMGLVFIEKGRPVVYEAVGPVRVMPLKDWIKRGEGEKFEVKRLKNVKELLKASAVRKLKASARTFLGKNYDARFQWSDESIYCSELVWKAYDRTLGIKLCPLKKMKDFNLADKAVKTELEKRHNGRIPMDEPVVAPVDIYRSKLLVTVVGKAS